ncbi:gamma-glutamylcyclotransferase [Myxosarcina sp. GI1]|uniref:gamma-glutamylcyclotransferase n=1 Tax=Myxosarcina sp. GI1 TaxID=1541065 RepID=UPI000569C117|nr:gamma-glutamylcyclotransferase [Myxosarcina sp. GI1]
MVLNRQALESKLLQKLLAHPELNLTILSDEELLTSIRETLQQKNLSQLWIFAYGSLIWNPLFEYRERRIVSLDGWHRQFCLKAPLGRGTLDNPGLVLGLEKGGSCYGVAYRLEIDSDLESELLLLWRREMVVGSYLPTWVKAFDGSQEFEAIAFTINSQHPMYINNLSTEQIINCLATAKGVLGSSAEYLEQTVNGLLTEELDDEELIYLYERVKIRQQELQQKIIDVGE